MNDRFLISLDGYVLRKGLKVYNRNATLLFSPDWREYAAQGKTGSIRALAYKVTGYATARKYAT